MKGRARLLLYLVTAAFGVYFLYPIYVLFLVAFVPTHFTILELYPDQVPRGLTLAYLSSALGNPLLIDALERSLEVATLVGVIAIGIGIPTAWGLSRLRPALAYALTTILFVVNMTPGLVIAIPISVTFIQLGLFDSVVGLALVQELVVLPIVTFLLLGAFLAIPPELEHQARVDGAGLLTTIYGVLVPLALPAVIASFLLAWMLSWDEFTFAVILSPIRPTLPIIIYDYITRGDLRVAAAFALVASLPVIGLTVLLQRYLKGEYLAGGLKG